jgi:hypothetical protein
MLWVVLLKHRPSYRRPFPRENEVLVLLYKMCVLVSQKQVPLTSYRARTRR